MPYDLTISDDVTINSDRSFGNLRFKNNSRMVIETGLNSDRRIMVNSLSGKGSIEVRGGGRLLLYVNQSAVLPGEIIAPEASSVFIFLRDRDTTLSLKGGNTSFQGYIYGPDARVDLSGTQNFTGAIIAGIVYSKGNVGITYENIPAIPGIGVGGGSTVHNFTQQYWVE